MATLVVGTFASFGGLGYAASGADSAYKVVKQAVVDKKVSVDVRKSAASAQYDTPGTDTGGTNTQGVQNSTQGGSLGVAGASGTLPFTGISLVATAAIGLGLLLTGLILRRRERTN